jgi:hypothetical protein
MMNIFDAKMTKAAATDGRPIEMALVAAGTYENLLFITASPRLGGKSRQLLSLNGAHVAALPRPSQCDRDHASVARPFLTGDNMSSAPIQ